jgi:hypothetical protein
MIDNPFRPLASVVQAQTRVLESLGVPYADPFNETAIISDVNDPLRLGRVKVTTSDGFVSDYIPVYGSNSGTLSARYIGTEVIVGKLNGRPEELFVLGTIRTSPEVGMPGLPTQLPIIDESTAAWNTSTDIGMLCNEGNQGKMYVLSNEMNQDVVVCLRRNNKQNGGKAIWAWKSLTNGLWVEKGFNPGNVTTPAITQSQLNNPGIPECNEALLGEVHDFTEDRGFRTTSMVCRKDENKNYSWVPLGSPAVYFRTTLPKCDERVHGMEAILDDGVNSEFMVCQRYQGLLRWVRQGKRIPQRFYNKDLPLNRINFLKNFKDIPALADAQGVEKGYNWAATKEVSEAAMDAMYNNVPITGTDPRLKVLLEAANMLPSSAFDEAATLKAIAKEALKAKTGIPADDIVDGIVNEISEGSKISPETTKILGQLGDAADILINGVKNGTVEDGLITVGRNVLQTVLQSYDPSIASVMTGLASGGIAGAVDVAVAIGLDELPPEVNKYVKPVIGIAKDLLFSEYPASLANVLNSASGKGLLGAISDTINGATKSKIVSPQLLNTVATKLTDGTLGEIPKLFNSMKNLNAVVKFPEDLGSLPKLASTALALAGQSDAMVNLLGKGGIGLNGVNSLAGGGFNSAKTVIEGIKGLKGVFGTGGSNDCPCGKNCRKTSHGQDSDDNNLLEKCGSVSSNNATAFAPTGDPINNNTNPVALSQKLKNTEVGKELIPLNKVNLTEAIQTVSRVKDMAEKFNMSRFADLTERDSELAYTFEAVEKAFKLADNNITRVESVERRLIDSMYNILKSVVYNKDGVSIMSNVLKDLKDVSEAVKDLYGFVEKLDAVKRGGSAGVTITQPLSNTFSNISGLSSLSVLNKKEALRILNNGILQADKEWNTMSPGLGYQSKLGEFGPMIPEPFSNEKTLFNTDRIMSISAESKIEDTLEPKNQVLDVNLSGEVVQKFKDTAVQVGESPLYDLITEREGLTSCEQS